MSMDVSDLGEKIKCSFRRNSYYNVYIQYAYFLTNTLFKVKLHFDASEFRNLLDFNEHIYIDITTGKVVRTAVIYDDALSNDDIGQYFKYSDYYFLDIENSEISNILQMLDAKYSMLYDDYFTQDLLYIPSLDYFQLRRFINALFSIK